jgi:biopolymer transport protein ExbD
MLTGSSKTAAVINMTPMIDILLVLLIICLVLQDHSKGLPSEVTQDAPDPAPATPARLDVVLRVALDRSLQVDDRPVALTELDARLRSLLVSRPGGVLFIDGAPELEYADVASVIDLARGAGWNRMCLLTERSSP